MLKESEYARGDGIKFVQIILGKNQALFALDDQGRVFQFLDRADGRRYFGWLQLQHDAYRQVRVKVGKNMDYEERPNIKFVQVVLGDNHALYALDDKGRVFQYCDKSEVESPHYWGWSQIGYDSVRWVLE